VDIRRGEKWKSTMVGVDTGGWAAVAGAGSGLTGQSEGGIAGEMMAATWYGHAGPGAVNAKSGFGA
jgi:hypothetical protein